MVLWGPGLTVSIGFQGSRRWVPGDGVPGDGFQEMADESHWSVLRPFQKWNGLNTEAERGTSSPEGKGEVLALSRREHSLHLPWGWGQGWHSCYEVLVGQAC